LEISDKRHPLLFILFFLKVYEGAESEFWDILLQAKSSNPVQTTTATTNESHTGWRSWNTNQSIKPSMNMTHTRPNEITISTTTSTTNTTMSTTTTNTNLSNNRLQQRKASTPPHYIHTTISNPFKLTHSTNSAKYHQEIENLTFPHEVVNSQEKKRQLKHQISLPSEKLQPTIDLLNKSLANQMLPIVTTTTTTPSATSTPTTINTGDNILTDHKTSNSHACITSSTSGVGVDTTHRNTNSSMCGDACSSKKLPDYFTRIIDTNNDKNSNSNNNNNNSDDDVITSNLVSNPIYLDESFINEQLTVDTKFTNDNESGANYQNNEITQCYMDKTSSDYDIIIDKSDDYNQTRLVYIIFLYIIFFISLLCVSSGTPWA
ncbi:unnamed protein product, partial [Trichobilharzia regenti]